MLSTSASPCRLLVLLIGISFLGACVAPILDRLVGTAASKEHDAASAKDSVLQHEALQGGESINRHDDTPSPSRVQAVETVSALQPDSAEPSGTVEVVEDVEADVVADSDAAVNTNGMTEGDAMAGISASGEKGELGDEIDAGSELSEFADAPTTLHDRWPSLWWLLPILLAVFVIGLIYGERRRVHREQAQAANLVPDVQGEDAPAVVEQVVAAASPVPDGFAVDLATQVWRLRGRIGQLALDGQPKLQRRMEDSINQFSRILREVDVRFDDPAGRPFVDGWVEIEVIAWETVKHEDLPEAHGNGPFILETVQPIVRRHNKILKRGQVIVGQQA